MLALPENGVQSTLKTDAFDKEIWCVLLQEYKGGSNYIAGYWSHTLNAKKQKLATTHWVCLAVVWAVTFWRPYLEGPRFMIRTDNEALEWMLTMAEATGKMERWLV